jgi:hydrogenase expression/formation protein HypC
MCLGIPAKVLEIDENLVAKTEISGVVKEVNLEMVPEAKVGDYVIVHAGFAIQTIDEEEAKETMKLLEEFAASDPLY